MKDRKEVAEYINSGDFIDENFMYWHVGLVELRALMDFIYEGQPDNGEEIHKDNWRDRGGGFTDL